jgi:transposase
MRFSSRSRTSASSAPLSRRQAHIAGSTSRSHRRGRCCRPIRYVYGQWCSGGAKPLDAQLLANLLRINRIPLAYIPPDEYQLLREITRHRGRMVRGLASVKTSLRALLARHTMQPLYKYPFGPRGLYWFSKQEFGLVENGTRNELLVGFHHYATEINAIDQRLEELQPRSPQTEVLTELHGLGLYSALLIIGEPGDVERFRRAKQVAAYAGLTARVQQSTRKDPGW